MTPSQKIKKTIMLSNEATKFISITKDNVDKIFTKYRYDLEDDIFSFRFGQVSTNLDPKVMEIVFECKLYTVRVVASQMYDGSWVGWDFYYGGGKNGEPEEYNWIENSYNLDFLRKEEKVITNYIFKLSE